MSNYQTATLRASAATSGTSEQDAAVTLPETVNEMWVFCQKTAEANADNLLTVRLQCQVNSVWFDVSWDSITPTVATGTAADSAAIVVRTPNIVESDSSATFTVLVHYKELPSNVVRVASISSGTTPANTFSVVATFMAQR